MVRICHKEMMYRLKSHAYSRLPIVSIFSVLKFIDTFLFGRLRGFGLGLFTINFEFGLHDLFLVEFFVVFDFHLYFFEQGRIDDPVGAS